MARDVDQLTDQEVDRLRGELDRLWQRLDQFEEDTVSLLQRQYVESVRGAIDRIEEVLAGVELDDAGNFTRDTQATAEARLAALESVEETREIWEEWSSRLDDLDGRLAEYYRVAEGVDSLGVASGEIVEQLKGQWPQDGRPGTGLAGRFYSMSEHHRRQLADSVTRNVLNGASREQLTQELSEHTEMAENQAEQRLRDSTMQFSRTVNEQKASELGYEYREYIGPEDSLTRPFCDRLLDEGPIFHIDEIREMDNGQTGAGTVLEAGGGYNCRHHWRAVKPWMLLEDEDWNEMTADEPVDTSDDG